MELPPQNLPPNLSVEIIKKKAEESPPYSPVEPKRLNLGAQLLTPDLTRPDLKVRTPQSIFMEKISASVKTPMEKKSPSIKTNAYEPRAEKRPSSVLLETSTRKNEFDRFLPSPVASKRPKIAAETLETENYLETRMEQLTPTDPVVKEKSKALPSDGLKTTLTNIQKYADDQPKSVASPASIHKFLQLDSSLVSPNEPKSGIETENMKFSKDSPVSPILSASAKPLQLSVSNTLKMDKKSKKGKKIKKTKKSLLSKSETKKQKTMFGSMVGSPQLFASPHLLKSPPDSILSSSPCAVPVQRLEVKPQNEVNPVSSVKANNSSKKKGADTPSDLLKVDTNVVPSSKALSEQKKEKKDKKKHVAKKKVPHQRSVEISSRGKSPPSITEKQSPITSPPWKKSVTGDEIKSPEGLKSSLFSVVASGSESLLSPVVSLPAVDVTASVFKSKKQLAVLEKEKKREEKKLKKEKKSKKKVCFYSHHSGYWFSLDVKFLHLTVFTLTTTLIQDFSTFLRKKLKLF